jgi:hypothetical protein
MHTSYVPHVSEQDGWDTFYILLEQNNTLGQEEEYILLEQNNTLGQEEEYILLEQNNTLGQEEENLGHVIKVDCVNSTGKKLDYLNSWTFGENVLKTNLL